MTSVFWMAAGIIAACLLFLSVIPCTLYLRQKRYGGFACALLLIILLYLIYQCIATYTNENLRAPVTMAAMEFFTSLPKGRVVLLLAAIAVTEVLMLLSRLQYEKSHITSMSVKEAVDSLPTGLCLYTADGHIVLSNRAMEDFCYKVTGEALCNGAQFTKRLRSGQLMPGCKTLHLEDTVAIVLPGDVARKLSLSVYEEKNNAFCLLSLSDITEFYLKNLALHAMQDEVMSLNKRLAEYNHTITDLTIEREILEAKVKIHDELGSNLLAMKRYVMNGGTEADRTAIEEKLRRNITFLSINQPIGTRSEYELMFEAAQRLGMRILIRGTLPQTEPQKHIIAAAIHECMTNNLRHAHGDELYIRISEEKGCITAVFTNNGEQATEEVQEKGGLISLRALTEKANGEMTICSAPSFSVTIKLPKEDDNAV